MSDYYYGHFSKDVNLDDLKGSVIVSVCGLNKDSEHVVFVLEDGRQFKMFHEQDCCESVYVADVCGDVNDIIGAEIIHFEERTSSGDEDSDEKPDEYCESFTWTFYDIQTTKGCLTVRWLGESNGYYSESVYVKWPCEG